MRDPYLQLDILQQALSSDKSKVAFLLGAGCPVSVKSDGKPLIPNIVGLTDLVCEKIIKENPDSIIAKIINRVKIDPSKHVTIEDILTHIRLMIEVVGEGEIEGMRKLSLEKIEKEICENISIFVQKELPMGNTPYSKLAFWIRGIPRNYSVEIFTPNYDLLVESALEMYQIPYFDGFVGSKKAFFDLHAIEHEDFPARWAKLWKLHGSINWWIDNSHSIYRGSSMGDGEKQMIFPTHLKYDQSRRMPYLAMQDRLGHFLAKGQSTLVVCGYSFVDQHLNSIIQQRLAANPRAICFGLLFDNLEKYPEAEKCALKTTNLTLLAKDKAVIGSQVKTWMINEENTSLEHDFCVDVCGENIECKIGDFDVFGKFLMNQIGYSIFEEKEEVGNEN